jgi:chromosome segregation ATPase
MEFDMTDAVETNEVNEEPKADDTKNWDKEKQRADMEHANFMKQKAQTEELAQRVSTYESKMASLEEQIKVNQQKQVEIQELDPLSADVPDLVKQNRKLIEKLGEMQTQFASLDQKAREFEAAENRRKQAEQRGALIDKVCKPLDDEYGAKFRSEAVKIAEDLVNSGKVPSPDDALDAYRILKDVYKDLKAKDKPEPKPKGLPVDTGDTAFSFQGTDLKEGSLRDVVGKMRGSIK